MNRAAPRRITPAHGLVGQGLADRLQHSLQALARFDLLVALAGLTSLSIVGLLLAIVWLSFVDGIPGTPTARLTIDNYLALVTTSEPLLVLANTLVFSGVTLVVSVVIGVVIAWLVERTDLRGKTVIYTTMTLGLLMPGFFMAMGWMFLLHPRIGVVNVILQQLFGFTRGPVDITSIVGMGWVEGLSLVSLVFVMTATTFRAMDPALEEAAAMHGASPRQVIWRVTLPLATPGLVAAGMYTALIGFSAFDTPAIIGLGNRIYTFSTYMLVLVRSLDRPPQYGLVGALSTVLVLMGILLSILYARTIRSANRYQIISGKSYRPKRVQLGKWALAAWAFIGTFFLFARVLPLMLLLWAAVLPFFQPPSLEALASVSFRNFEAVPWMLVQRGVVNSVLAMLLVPTITLLISVAFSWTMLYTKTPLRQYFDAIAFVPHAVPSIIFGIAVLVVVLFVIGNQLPLYGSLASLIIAYVLVRLSFGTRMTNSALIQIHKELVEAAEMAGAGPWKVKLRILVPLIAPALVGGWLWIALMSLRELALPTILFSPSNLTLSVVVWNFWQGGQLGQAAAVSLVMILFFLPITLLYWRIGNRRTDLA